jgi:hypothetical protein
MKADLGREFITKDFVEKHPVYVKDWVGVLRDFPHTKWTKINNKYRI